MSGQRRVRRVEVRFTTAEHQEVLARAVAHRMSTAGFIRSAALSGAALTAETDDAWWDTLSPSRKRQVRGWLDHDGREPAPPLSDPLW